MIKVEDGTAKGIYSAVKQSFPDLHVPMKNIIGYPSDTTNSSDTTSSTDFKTKTSHRNATKYRITITLLLGIRRSFLAFMLMFLQIPCQLIIYMIIFAQCHILGQTKRPNHIWQRRKTFIVFHYISLHEKVAEYAEHLPRHLQLEEQKKSLYIQQHVFAPIVVNVVEVNQISSIIWYKFLVPL